MKDKGDELKNISNLKVDEDTHIELTYNARKRRITLHQYIQNILQKEMIRLSKKNKSTEIEIDTET